MKPNPILPWPICMPAVELIADAEGCRLKAYKCPAGVWTVGWGETDNVTARTTVSQEQADQLFLDSLLEYSARVRALCTVQPTENELGALVSLAYNIGIDALAKSTPLRQHNAGDTQAAARAFALWNKARVRGMLQPLPGLTARRAAEAALYLRPDEGTPSLRMPQAVQTESSLAKSPIARGGAVTIGAGVVGVASQMSEHIGTLGTATQQARSFVVDTLGVPAGAFLPVVLIGVGAVVMWQRRKQRTQGWA